MKRWFWLFLVVMVLLPLGMQARSCSKCGGSGQMKVFHSLSTYGVSNKKQRCPICKEWVPVGEVHYDTCDRCGGSGQVETAMDRVNAERSARLEDEANEGLSHLTPAELSQFEALKELLKGRKERVECTACGATGRCPQCNGSGWAGGRECFICSMTGKCIGCYGTGTARWQTVYPTEEEKKEIMGRMAELVSNAVKRDHGSVGNRQLDQDLDEAEEIEEEVSDNDTETEQVAKDEDDDDSWLGVLGFIVIAAFLYWIFRKPRNKTVHVHDRNQARPVAPSQEQSHTNSQRNFCPECGEKLDGKSKFCPNCGHKLI